MTHLYIELNTGLTEEVNSFIISKLYELAISGDLDETSDLKGRLHSTVGYGDLVSYLTETFSDLYITLDKSYIRFADTTISNKLKYYIGDGTGTAIQDAQNVLVFGATRETSSFGTLRWFGTYDEKILPTTFDEFKLFINVTEIQNKAFESWINLQSIKLPPNITTIGTLCFLSCQKITSLTGLSNITTIPNNAFQNCYKLETVDIDWSKITNVEGLAFMKCNSLLFGELDLSTVTTLRQEAFRECYGITKLLLGNNTTISGSSVFDRCTGMTEANLGSGITLANNATAMFYGCTNLTTVTGLSGITTIPSWTFSGCTSLSSVDIDWSKITSIGTCALYKCPIGTGLTLELNLTNQSSHFGDAFGGTKFDKIIVHCNWSGNGDGNHPPFWGLPYTTYIDASDCILHTANGYSLSSVNGDNSLVTVIYPPSVNQIRSGSLGFKNALGTFKYMIILNTTPPDINVDNNNPFSSAFSSNNTSDSILHIYVPDSAVSDYLADSKWSQLGGNSGTITILLRLHGLSELPAGVWTTGLASQYLTPAQLVTT